MFRFSIDMIIRFGLFTLSSACFPVSSSFVFNVQCKYLLNYIITRCSFRKSHPLWMGIYHLVAYVPRNKHEKQPLAALTVSNSYAKNAVLRTGNITLEHFRAMSLCRWTIFNLVMARYQQDQCFRIKTVEWLQSVRNIEASRRIFTARLARNTYVVTVPL